MNKFLETPKIIKKKSKKNYRLQKINWRIFEDEKLSLTIFCMYKKNLKNLKNRRYPKKSKNPKKSKKSKKKFVWPFFVCKCKKNCRPTWFLCESWDVVVAVIHTSVGKWLTGSLEDLEWRCPSREALAQPVTQFFCTLGFREQVSHGSDLRSAVKGWPNKFWTGQKEKNYFDHLKKSRKVWS